MKFRWLPRLDVGGGPRLECVTLDTLPFWQCGALLPRDAIDANQRRTSRAAAAASMLRGIIANDPRSPRPEKHGNPRNKPRRLAAALATILVIVLAPHNTQVDAGPRTKLEFTTCEAPTTRHNRTTRRVVGAACSTNDVDAGDCVRDATRWSTRYRCLPSFVIGGAQKAATGSLAKWLE